MSYTEFANNWTLPSAAFVCGDIYVPNTKDKRRKASDWIGAKRRSRTLRAATVSDVHAMTVGTVVSVHAEAWCVVTSEQKVATRTLLRYYAKR